MPVIKVIMNEATNYRILIVLFTKWKVSKYGVISGPYFPAFGLNTEKYEVIDWLLSIWGQHWHLMG